MKLPVVIVKRFGELVAATEAIALPILQAASSDIVRVNYQHGHLLEIIATLQRWEKNNETQAEKYPLIALLQDFPEERGAGAGIESETNLNVIFATRTPDPAADAAERYERVFLPILYPLYAAFLEAVNNFPGLNNYGSASLRHRKYDRVAWGKSGLYKNDANIFNDRIDAIEIVNLRLNFKSNYC